MNTARVNGNIVNASELISGIADISIQRNKIDPRIFVINIKILTKNFLMWNNKLFFSKNNNTSYSNRKIMNLIL